MKHDRAVIEAWRRENNEGRPKRPLARRPRSTQSTSLKGPLQGRKALKLPATESEGTSPQGYRSKGRTPAQALRDALDRKKFPPIVPKDDTNVEKQAAGSTARDPCVGQLPNLYSWAALPTQSLAENVSKLPG